MKECTLDRKQFNTFLNVLVSATLMFRSSSVLWLSVCAFNFVFIFGPDPAIFRIFPCRETFALASFFERPAREKERILLDEKLFSSV